MVTIASILTILTICKKVVADYINTRACTQGKLIVPGKKAVMQRTCITDTIRIWNSCPTTISRAATLATAKKEINKYVKTLPI